MFVFIEIGRKSNRIAQFQVAVCIWQKSCQRKTNDVNKWAQNTLNSEHNAKDVWISIQCGSISLKTYQFPFFESVIIHNLQFDIRNETKHTQKSASITFYCAYI